MAARKALPSICHSSRITCAALHVCTLPVREAAIVKVGPRSSDDHFEETGEEAVETEVQGHAEDRLGQFFVVFGGEVVYEEDCEGDAEYYEPQGRGGNVARSGGILVDPELFGFDFSYEGG